jgi:hypothetical protein
MARTMSAYKIDAILQWQNETESRKKALKQAEQLPGEPFEAFEERVATMPQARTWLAFAMDPFEDGAPKDPNSDSPGMLDPNDPLNSDALLLDPSWSNALVGEDADTVYFYRQAQKGRESWGDRIIESIYPSIVHKTAAGDYVPNLWNLFQNKDGSRYEGHEVDSFWLRSAYHGGGAVWNLLMGTGVIILGSIALRKALPNVAAAVADIPDEVIEVVAMD